MKRIAIITLYDDVNWGNKLQNYALQTALRSLGYDTKSIVNRDMLWKPTIKQKINKVFCISKRKAKMQSLQVKRKQKISGFSERFISIGETIGYSDLSRIADEYDCYVVGSDQVWHNWTRAPKELYYFFLQFVPIKKRVCYAPSFGFDTIPEREIEKYRIGLNGFALLSCREASGCALIERIAGRKAELVCDPTMLLTAQQWDQVMERPDFTPTQEYILLYFLGGIGASTQNQIDKIAKENKLQIVDINSTDKPEYYVASPSEFVYLIAHAKYVFTDSFHGSVFSILYHRPFHIYRRLDGDGSNMHGRLETLLEVTGIKMDDLTVIDGEAWMQTYEIAEQKLEQLRNKSMDYLEKAIRDSVSSSNTD